MKLLTAIPRRYFSLTRAARNVPWYEQEVSKMQPSSEPSLPALPADSPRILPPLINFVAKNLGLSDLEIIDARSKKIAMGPALMLVGTGRSSRHLAAAATELIRWLKDEYGIVTDNEGLLSSNFIRIHNRRARRRAESRRMASGSPQRFTKADSWVSIDTHSDNVYVHLFTSDRRQDVDLPSLIDDDPLVECAEALEDYRPPARLPDGRRGMHTATSVSPEPLNVMVSGPAAAVRSALENQAAGNVLNDDGIEDVLREICYGGQSFFSSLSASDPVSRDRWAALCDAKAALLLKFYSDVLRPQGRSLLLEPRWVLLLYRTFCCPSRESVNVTDALRAPYPVSSLDMFHNFRLPPFRLILEKQNALFDTETFLLVLQTLANGHTWDTFWRLLDTVTSTSVVDPKILEAALALIVRGGSERQLRYALSSFLPELLLREGSALTPSMVLALKSGLAFCDPEKKSFGSLRELVQDTLPAS